MLRNCRKVILKRFLKTSSVNGFTVTLLRLPFNIDDNDDYNNNEKVLKEMQTLHAGGSKAEPKNFAPLQTPFPWAGDSQNLISWRWSLPLPTNPVW